MMVFPMFVFAGMMDAAKVADLVLLMIDGSFGLEMETFEFLNLLQVRVVM
jgi:ribosome biogenesis protein BMS1